MELTAVGIGGVIFLGCGNILFASELQTYCKTACFANRCGNGVAVELTNVKTVYLDMG